MRRAVVPRPPARAQPLGLRSSCARCAPSTERSWCVCAVALPSRCALTSTLHSPEIEVMGWVPMAGRRQSGDPDLQSQRPSEWVCDASPCGFTSCSGGRGGLVRH